MKLAALIIFILMYVLIIMFQDIKEYIALGTALGFIALGILPPDKIVDVLKNNYSIFMMLIGSMIVVYYFVKSNMPTLIADKLLDISPNVLWVTVLMSAFSSFISIFIDNTATVLMIAPIAIAICKKVKLNPVPMILCLAISSNMQGVAILVGDTTSIMLGWYAKMSFVDFFIMDGRPSIFFAVELGALVALIVMAFMFRNRKEKVKASHDVEVTDIFPTIVVIALILSLIASSVFPKGTDIINGIICVGYALISMIGDVSKHKVDNQILDSLKNIDFQTIFLLIGLFFVIGGINNVGLIEDFANGIFNMGGTDPFLLYTIIVFGSVFVSSFTDNIPYIATMLPVIQRMCTMTSVNPNLLYFGLMIGATLGGNITPIGASSNITAVSILNRQGYKVGFKEFLKYGLPLTLSAIITGYLFVWFVWK